MSLYDYCAGDPINRFDPDGMMGTAVKDAAVNSAVYVGGAFVQDTGRVVDTVDNGFYGAAAGISNAAAVLDSAMQSGFTDFNPQNSQWSQVTQAIQANLNPAQRSGSPKKPRHGGSRRPERVGIGPLLL